MIATRQLEFEEIFMRFINKLNRFPSVNNEWNGMLNRLSFSNNPSSQ